MCESAERATVIQVAPLAIRNWRRQRIDTVLNTEPGVQIRQVIDVAREVFIFWSGTCALRLVG